MSEEDSIAIFLCDKARNETQLFELYQSTVLPSLREENFLAFPSSALKVLDDTLTKKSPARGKLASLAAGP
jgi:hypothetical protein